MSLILSIKCIIPNKIQKNYTIKIYNRELDIHMQIENNFRHNYQYIFKLWPCKNGEGHTIELQLKEQIGGVFQVLGKATTKILYSGSGDHYKFHGNRQENEMFLMKFYVEQSLGESNEEVLLKKMNQEMEQNLQKYRREIQNYQEFLYFTNNVIKELNDDVPTNRLGYHPNIKQQPRSESSSGRNISPKPSNETQKIEETARASAIRPQNKVFHHNLQETNIKNRVTDSHINQKQQTIYSGKSQKSSQVDASRTSKARSFLSKYRYLQEGRQQQQQGQSDKKEAKRQASPSTINTPINILRQQIPEQKQSGDQNEKSFQLIQISNQIKQRRQQYLVPHQRKSSSKDRRIIETPILRLSTDMSNHSHHKQFQQRSFEQATKKDVKAIQVNYEPNGKVSTRSQTGLEDMNNKMDKNIYLQDKSIQNMNNLSTNDRRIRDARVTIDNQKDYQIIQTVNVSINEKRRSQSSQNDVGKKSSRKITRRKKIAGNNQMNSSAINDNDKIEDIKRTSKIQKSIAKPTVPSPNQGFVTKITIFNIQSLFYTNFKNTIKKCIIEHNHQVYQTQMEENNLKETSWADRIVINSISSSQQIIFQVYSLRMNQMNLQGSAIVNINQILAKQNKHIKLYLYYEDIAVGNIKFDLERQQRSYKRLTISLPEIKGKHPQQSEIKPKTIRNSIFPSQASKVQSRVYNERFLHPSIKCKQSFPSQSEHHSISNDMTSKIRNMKLQRRNRLK